MDSYCNFCGEESIALMQTRDGKSICRRCAMVQNFCEICGTVKPPGGNTEDQLHYEEECFK